MNHNIKIEYEQRYKTFDDRIVWNLPIFYNSITKTFGYFVVDSHGYNDDGTVDNLLSILVYTIHHIPIMMNFNILLM